MAKSVNILVKIDTTDGVQSIGDLNQEITSTISTLGEMEAASSAIAEKLREVEVGTAEYELLRKELIKVNTEIKNQELAMEALDNEQVAAEIKSVAGGLTDMAGGLALVGVSGQNMEKVVQTFAKVEAASKIVTGGMETWLSTQKLLNNAIAAGSKNTKLLALSQKMAAVQAKIAAIGMRILNAAMNASPIFLIITALAAVAAGFAFFATSSNDAEKATEDLNNALEAQNKLLESQRSLRSALSSGANVEYDLRIKNANKLIELTQKEIENIQKKKVVNGELSAQEEIDLKEKINYIDILQTRINSITMEKFANEANEAYKVVNEDVDLMANKFSILKSAIDATATEDGIDDINYRNVAKEVTDLEIKYTKLSTSFRDGSVTSRFYKKELANLVNTSSKLTSKISLLNGELGSAEQEKWEKVIESSDNLNTSFITLTNSAVKLNIAESNLNNNKEEENTEKRIKAAEKEAKRLDELQKARENAERIRLENRKNRFDEINSKLKREEKAVEELAKLKAKASKDELDDLDLAFGNERDSIIDGAIKRELKANEDKFTNLEIDEETYQSNRKEIVSNGIDNLLPEEKRLLDYKKELLKEEKQAIIDNNAFDLEKTIKTTEEINSRIKLLKIQHDKEIKLIDVDQDTKSKEKEKLKKYKEIYDEFRDSETQAIKENAKAQENILKLQYEKDVKNLEDNSEEKKRITAEYNLEVQKLNNDTQIKISQLNEKIAKDKTLSEHIIEATEEYSQIIQFAINSMLQAINLVSQALTEQNEQASYQREIRYNKESEALEASLANQEISQEQYNEKLALLNQKKEEDDLAAKRKGFQQNKALNISNAIIAGAQSVIAGLAAGLSVGGPTGLVLGPAMAATAGALSAVQIGLIAAQKFRAARGGVVPNNGKPSHIDSVDALLAPGETVINSESSRMFPQLLSQINTAGGGVALAPSLPIKTNTTSRRGDGNTQQIVKAYVVESEMTDAQKRVKRIKDSNSF
ncbi:MAG: Unknown protein [uncultured Sulfurovum sp.]|uniref:Uncharacterized protein n=1 Tax=uncultured Sulfurovum sp. TaxID=269237 RepID=A0A6S6STD0_9BACT|nr:MAG: Unknown protein [uncultured Sulfurovum sp.]